MTIRVLLADDQTLLRGTLRLLLDNSPGYEVVGEASDGDEALALVRAHAPDVVLMDIEMPRADGLRATRSIREDPSLDDVKILVLTTFETEQYVAEAMLSGANGFIGKGTDPPELLAAVDTVARGDMTLSAAAALALMQRFREQQYTPLPTTPGRLAELTPREREMVTLAAKGLSNDGIAQDLQLSRHTVKTHINRAMAKLGVSERAQLVVIAYEFGLVRPGGHPPAR
ncbi:response regulator transcription factor [Streptomyces sp. NBC_01478]|uniref:response regulator transcription factor n=1 Tax=Streptomyces sp. NBC_01478 TaxID=2903882 RepID=UPI002E30008C|nr:response regulator transcription factor [Streptomyces sp. NBC_01478]